MCFMAQHDTDLCARGQQLGQQADPVIGRTRCAPRADILNPCLAHQGSPDFWDDRDRLARLGHENKPRPRGALPEKGLKTGKVGHLWFGHQQQAIKPLRGHAFLCAGRAHQIFGVRKPAWGRLQRHGVTVGVSAWPGCLKIWPNPSSSSITPARRKHDQNCA